MHDALVDRAEQFLNAPFHFVFGKRIGAIEPGQDFQRVLLAAEIDQHQVHVLAHAKLFHVEPVAVIRHQDRPVAESAALIHAPAARRSRDLTAVGKLHFAARRHFQVVGAIECPRRQHADGRAGGKALLHRKIGFVVVDDQAAHVIMSQHLVGDAGDIAPEAALLGFLQEGFRFHRDFVGTAPLSAGSRSNSGSATSRAVRHRHKCPGRCRSAAYTLSRSRN